MIALATKIVDGAQLLHVVEASLIAGVGISLVFSLVILGTVRAGEHRQRGRHALAGAHAVLAAVALAACIAVVVYGVSSMLSK